MIVKKAFKVEVDGATFHFSKPTKRDFEKLKEENSKFDLIWDRLIKIEGLKDEDGQSIEYSADMVIDLPIDIVTEIVKGWREQFKAMTGLEIGGGDPAKNEQKPS